MFNYYDYKKFAILYVDDEEKSLKLFTKAFGDNFRILTANNAQTAFETLEIHQDGIGVLITDQRMPGEKGVQLLEKARQLRPGIVRILTTAYTDIQAAIQAVNSGAIYHYVTKPWEPEQLEGTLKRALEFFMVQRERDQLLREKLAVLHNLMITDRVISLGVLASGLGHHMRNALQAVQTFLDLAPAKLEEEVVRMEQLRNPNFWKDFYESVQGQVQRITRLLDHLGEAGDVPHLLFNDEVLLSNVLNEVVRRMQPKLADKKIKVLIELPDSLPPLKVDRFKFYRLFELLFEDEIASLPAGSTIRCHAAELPLVGNGAPEIRIEVQDNGPGLPQEAIRSVFDPFSLRVDDPQQFGVNLMACYFIVYHHGGKIEAKSQGTKGVTFTLTIPTAPLLTPKRYDDKEFMTKVLLNDQLWQKLLAGD